MIAVREEAPRAPKKRVESLREPDVETLHAAGKRTLGSSLDDHMHVIALHRVANNLKVLSSRLHEAASDRFVRFLTPERADIIQDSESHMNRRVPPKLDTT